MTVIDAIDTLCPISLIHTCIRNYLQVLKKIKIQEMRENKIYKIRKIILDEYIFIEAIKLKAKKLTNRDNRGGSFCRNQLLIITWFGVNDSRFTFLFPV